MKTYKILFTGALVAIALGSAVPARGEFGMPQLLTVSPREQADSVSSSALSANGRYLVFAGSLDATTGILRRDLQTGVTEPVAAGDAYGTAPVRDASSPSISADGRYISFTTAAVLNPAEDNNSASDVYVRDMEASVPSGGAACAAEGPCAYTLVSALDGVATGLTYSTGGGSGAAPRQAISADGRRVAFVVQAASDLAGPDTPGGQVTVRDLDTQRTTLVSAERDPATGAMTGRPVAGGAITGNVAALSADGTTVAWSGAHIDQQAATVAGDPARTTDAYNEPLWRRIADGPSAPTRRVAGPADPDAPGCPVDGTFADPNCQGPYPTLSTADPLLQVQGGWVRRPVTGGLTTPSLSADGRTVAFLGGPLLLPALQPSGSEDDLFVADMRAGITRRAAVRRLTQDPGAGIVSDVAVSPDGRRIAFATARTTFALSPPSLISTPPAVVGRQELWLVDLDGSTLQRLSRTVDGGPASDGTKLTPPPFPPPSSPSFDATGRMVAWDSDAANLVAVDANHATDTFMVVDQAVPAGTPGRVDIAPPPPVPEIPRAWRLALRAVAQRDGSVRFDATVPGAGVLRATVQATVPVTKHVKVRTRGGGHRTVRRRVLSKRQVAVASLVARGGGLSRLSVHVTKAYRTLVKAKTGLDATAKLTFAAPSRATLRDTLAVRFRVVPAKKKQPAQTTKKGTAKR
ncbi:MAG TPA: hypothetical protein VNT55_07515 [Baekduia sp.]|nr:hypothetical protein [Baekduia sp.]